MRIRLLALLLTGPMLWAQTTNWQTLVAEKKWAAAEPLLLQALNSAPQSVPELEALAQVYRSTGRLAQADPILDRLVPLAPTVASGRLPGRHLRRRACH